MRSAGWVQFGIKSRDFFTHAGLGSTKPLPIQKIDVLGTEGVWAKSKERDNSAVGIITWL